MNYEQSVNLIHNKTEYNVVYKIVLIHCYT